LPKFVRFLLLLDVIIIARPKDLYMNIAIILQWWFNDKKSS